MNKHALLAGGGGRHRTDAPARQASSAANAQPNRSKESAAHHFLDTTSELLENITAPLAYWTGLEGAASEASEAANRSAGGAFGAQHHAQIEYNEGLQRSLTLREHAAIWYEDSSAGLLWRTVVALLSFASFILFLVQSERQDASLPIDSLVLADFVMLMFFLVDLALRVFTSLNKLRRLRKYDSLIDITCGTAVILAFAGIVTPAGRVINLNYLRMANLLRFSRVIAILLRLGDIGRQMVRLAFLIFVLIIVAAATFYVSEAEEAVGCRNAATPLLLDSPDAYEEAIDDCPSRVSLFQAFYFIVVTYSTVGYGDITPSSDWSRGIMIIGIAIGIVLIPIEITELNELLWARSDYGGSYHTSRGDHVVLCGDLTIDRIVGFLNEFFHTDHGKTNTKLVILSPIEPSVDLKLMLKEPFYAQMVVYLNGSALKRHDLVERAGIQKAKAVFVVSHTLHNDKADEYDASNVLRCMAIRKENPTVPIFASLIQARSRRHLLSCGATTFSAEQYRVQLMAKNGICPGFSTMIAQLTNSSSIDPESSLEQWQREYFFGASSEIYTTRLPEQFDGMKFFDLTRAVYALLNITIFAVVHKPLESGAHAVLLTPDDYALTKDQYIASIAQDASDVQKMRDLTKEDIAKVLSDMNAEFGGDDAAGGDKPAKGKAGKRRAKRASADDDAGDADAGNAGKGGKKGGKKSAKATANATASQSGDDDGDNEDGALELAADKVDKKAKKSKKAKKAVDKPKKAAPADKDDADADVDDKLPLDDSADDGDDEAGDEDAAADDLPSRTSSVQVVVTPASQKKDRKRKGSDEADDLPKRSESVYSSSALDVPQAERAPTTKRTEALARRLSHARGGSARAKFSVREPNMDDPRAQKLRFAFDRLKNKKSNTITVNELETMMAHEFNVPITHGQAESLLVAFDRTQSGDITFPEFYTVMETLDSMRDEDGLLDTQAIAGALGVDDTDAERSDASRERAAVLRPFAGKRSEAAPANDTIAEDLSDDEIDGMSHRAMQKMNRAIERGNVKTLLLLSQLSESVQDTRAYQSTLQAELDRIHRWSTYDVAGHVVLSGSLHGLRHVLRVLRVRDRRRCVPLVILHPTMPTEKFWSSSEQLQQVYFVKGSPLESVDLARCNVQNARAFVTLADVERESTDSSGESSLSDWKAILSVLGVLDRANTAVCAELLCGENVKFLPGARDGGQQYTLSVPFAAGRVWSPSLMDSILVLPYYERYLLIVLERLASGRSLAYGGVAPGAASSLMRRVGRIKQGIVSQIRVPDVLLQRPDSERTYLHVYQYISTQLAAVPLALYRHPSSCDSPDWFVYTAPKPDTVVNGSDRLIVLTVNELTNLEV